MSLTCHTCTSCVQRIVNSITNTRHELVWYRLPLSSKRALPRPRARSRLREIATSTGHSREIPARRQ